MSGADPATGSEADTPRRRARPRPKINPSGRPLERPGFEAAFAGAIIVGWMVTMGLIVGFGRAWGYDDTALPSLGMGLVSVICLWGAERTAGGARHLVWPASAFGIVGPISLGYAMAFATPELRSGPIPVRLAVITSVSGIAMVPFLFRYRLPGLVSPIITFALVGLFLTLYGTDMERLREVEGFSARGILAAMVANPLFAALFGGLALAGVVLARHLDLNSDNFGLAAARPLHLVGGGVVALVAGRAAAELPGPADLLALAALYAGAMVWTLRINRVAVAMAMHLALLKPLFLAVEAQYGVGVHGPREWTILISAVVWSDLLVWPLLHRLSAEAGWTLGPGGRVPPDRPGFGWRYWPYATEEQLDRWAASRAAKRARRRSWFRRAEPLPAEEQQTGTDRP